VKFQVLDIVPHAPHPVTGEIISVHERLQRVVETAVRAERLGFDSYAVGERHAGEFVSSAPTVLQGALAQATERILLSTGVTVLSLLDPVRVAEDYATVDQLSGGRLEIVIGKGNEDKHFGMFGLDTRKGKTMAFTTMEDAVAHGPALVGTPERVAAKILDYHKSYHHDVQSVSINPVLPYPQQQEVLGRFAEEVIPLVQRETSTTLWGPHDPGRAAGLATLHQEESA
jgi:alkanesulfonate monooxygenase SsuD/methylene tetrahydromethanopterin reductase-like flavin-dependent oxidoreductase (luciferase family)